MEQQGVRRERKKVRLVPVGTCTGNGEPFGVVPSPFTDIMLGTAFLAAKEEVGPCLYPVGWEVSRSK